MCGRPLSPRIERLKRIRARLEAPTFLWQDGTAPGVDREPYHRGADDGGEDQAEGPAGRPTHPGAVMREIIEDALKLSVAEAAERMGVSRQTLDEMLRGDNRVTAEMALRFGKLVGAEPALYLHRQNELDLWQAERRLAADLKRIMPAAQ